MLDHSKITLGELLSSFNAIIKRNALSILKQLQATPEKENPFCWECKQHETDDGRCACTV